MQPNVALERALNRCYEVFSVYPRPTVLHASPLRDAAQILKDLTSAPLRELSGEMVGPYAGYALTTVGDVVDYKHFLPRILEQAVYEPVWMGTEPAIIANRLEMAEWLGWPRSEQEAIREVFAEAWRQSVDEHPDDADAIDWLYGIAVGDMNLAEAIQVWDKARSANSVLQLSSFMTTSAEFLCEPESENRGYWTYVSEANIAFLRRWTFREATAQRLEVSRLRVAAKDNLATRPRLAELERTQTDPTAIAKAHRQPASQN